MTHESEEIQPHEAEISLEELRQVLCDESAPIAKRMRSVFLLKDKGGMGAIEAFSAGLESESVLLCHEIGYVMGQMQDPRACPVLERVLKDKTKDPIVRHEAAEALGALGDMQYLPLLEQFAQDPEECEEVRHTCEIAVERLRNLQNAQEVVDEDNPPSLYFSVDPAPPLKGKHTVEELFAILCDRKLSLYRRYEAMFKLRNLGTSEAVEALGNSLLLELEAKDGEEAASEGVDALQTFPDAVFRHEVCYVLGQIQHPAAVKALTAMLRSPKEHAMVRHEAAEALGSIAESAEILEEFQKDADVIVRESCDVALDLHEYWSNGGIANE